MKSLLDRVHAQGFSSLAAEVWRVVEDQIISSTRKLVASQEEHEILEEELEKTKPAISSTMKKLHYLLYTPFRYPPLRYGSRFGTVWERSLWYGSMALETALAETAFYRLAFMMSSVTPSIETVQVRKTAFTAKIRTKQGVDLTQSALATYREVISDPMTWRASQALGSMLRTQGAAACLYYSARIKDTEAKNMALFHEQAFEKKQPIQYKNLIQISTTTTVEYILNDIFPQKWCFSKDDFIVNGRFPFPA